MRIIINEVYHNKMRMKRLNPIMESQWIKLYDKLIKFLDKKDPERKFKFSESNRIKFEKLREEFRSSFIRSEIGRELVTARIWVDRLKTMISKTEEKLKLSSTTYSKELKSFIEDPLSHLKKKIFFYTYDLLRGKITPEEFKYTAAAAIKTSLRTNMRSIYQCWVYTSILYELAHLRARMIYPEHRVLTFERAGKQKLGTIPPSCILYLEGRGFISFFLEAPRPLGWEGDRDLRRVWALYTTMRPDILVYSGKVLNIANLESNPPIIRPDVIIECKELKEWWYRIRDMRGHLAKPLTAEEWRSMWIEGLWDGLADILGVERKERGGRVKNKRTLRLRDIQIVTLYRTLFKPKKMFLVSRTRVPRQIKSYLKERQIEVIDAVGFKSSALKPLISYLVNLANQSPNIELVELKKEYLDLLDKLMNRISDRGITMDRGSVIGCSLMLALRRFEDFLQVIKDSS
ncbi:MAG: hypothetical protein DRN53_00845 [Thermoprotei archaeon]|nr:MAG: hypothetical protein DRN53_00845 [Thermoprotei archaeon]